PQLRSSGSDRAARSGRFRELFGVAGSGMSRSRGGVFMKTTALLGAVIAAALVSIAPAQTRDVKPAFPGQTKAPAPAKASPRINAETIATGLNGGWSISFLPDGNFLIAENEGFLRVVRPDGVVYAPIAGLPPIKSVAAQGLHDVLLDPD